MQHDPSTSDKADARIAQARVDMLFDAFDEVKETVKAIAETVSIIKVFDHQIKQHGQDFLRLEQDLRETRTKLDESQRNLLVAIRQVESDTKAAIKTVEDTADTTKNSLRSKMSYVQGAIAAVTLLGALLYAIAVWWASRYIDITDDNTRYIHALKTLGAEEHLRENLTRPPNVMRLEDPPVVRYKDEPPSADEKKDAATPERTERGIPRL